MTENKNMLKATARKIFAIDQKANSQSYLYYARCNETAKRILNKGKGS